jgi:hypothetical protein
MMGPKHRLHSQSALPRTELSAHHHLLLPTAQVDLFGRQPRHWILGLALDQEDWSGR